MTRIVDWNSYAKTSELRGLQAFPALRRTLPSRTGTCRNFVIVDAASGTGTFLANFLRPVMPEIRAKIDPGMQIQVHRFDINRENLIEYDEFVPVWGNDPQIKANREVCSITDINLPSKSVDFMLFCNALEHLSANLRSEALKEAHRLLSDDGVLCVLGPVSSPWERLRFGAMQIMGLPKGPVNIEHAQALASPYSTDSFISRYHHDDGEYYFKPGAAGQIGKAVKDPFIAAQLLELLRNTPEVADPRKDPDHKVWFSPASLLSELNCSGFRLCENGEDYFVYGSTHGQARAIAGTSIQSLMPFGLRKFFAHGEIFVLNKVDN